MRTRGSRGKRCRRPRAWWPRCRPRPPSKAGAARATPARRCRRRGAGGARLRRGAARASAQAKLPQLHARVLLASAGVFAAAGDVEAAQGAARESLALCEGSPDRGEAGVAEVEAAALLALAHLALRGGAPGEAEQALARAERALGAGHAAGAAASAGLGEHRALLRALLLAARGEFAGLAAEAAAAAGAPPARGAARDAVSWWRFEPSAGVMAAYLRSLSLPADCLRAAAAGDDNAMGDALKEAGKEVRDGLALLSGGEGGGGGARVDGTERAGLRLLLLERAVALALTLTDYVSAANALVGMMQCANALGCGGGGGTGLGGTGAGREAAAAVHCAVGAYLLRCGESEAALAHLAEAGRAPKGAARLRAAVLRAAVLLWSSEGAGADERGAQAARERAAREASAAVARVEELCAAHCAAGGAGAGGAGAGGAGLWALAHLRVLRARLVLSRGGAGAGAGAGADGAALDAQLAEAHALAEGTLADPPLQVEATLLQAEALRQRGDAASALALAERARALARAIGDQWLLCRSPAAIPRAPSPARSASCCQQRECTVGTWVGATVGGAGGGGGGGAAIPRAPSPARPAPCAGRQLSARRAAGRALRSLERLLLLFPDHAVQARPPPSLPYKVDTSRPSLPY